MKILQMISIGLTLGLITASPYFARAAVDVSKDVATDVAPSKETVREPSADHSRRNDEGESDQDRRILERGLISHGQYITGGVIGSIFGFGIGHGIQHRYGDKGWIFTTSGVVGLGLYLGGIAACTKTNTDSSNNTSYSLDCSSGAATAIAAGLAIDVGFHIWEIIDLWVAPPRINRRYEELRGVRPSALETTRILPLAMTAGSGKTVSVVPGVGLSMQF